MITNKTNPGCFLFKKKRKGEIECGSGGGLCDQCRGETDTMIMFDNESYTTDGYYRYIVLCADCIGKADEVVRGDK